ncbi:MAG: hypothetical protein M3N59_03235 [bacterium]|nr:hypothetical protein [bacterium]
MTNIDGENGPEQEAAAHAEFERQFEEMLPQTDVGTGLVIAQVESEI